ncbi:hypothetical protein AV274_0098 [Blastocystis sp. ATCC 50177/Nand II]|uniref:Uncharacterized protein n=1 Tax=Blastocystis sp. subtype 1 (strain ATCC 50177 / NandII) TaxID=478820 RepID=A0A196SM78_BLAHN|nr:hypothetical protein AV274_0098 [Blastocystis sp. ATCC 50177/Nand II]
MTEDHKVRCSIHLLGAFFSLFTAATERTSSFMSFGANSLGAVVRHLLLVAYSLTQQRIEYPSWNRKRRRGNSDSSAVFSSPFLLPHSLFHF